MKSPEGSRTSTAFLAVISLGWLAMIHGVAFFIFGVSMLAAWVVVGGLAATIVAIISYLAWEFRQSKPVPTIEQATRSQDVSLLMLSRSSHYPAPIRQRRTRTRLTGQHPVTDRIIALHRPPHIDRRQRNPTVRPELVTSPLIELSGSSRGVMPSAN